MLVTVVTLGASQRSQKRKAESHGRGGPLKFLLI